MPRSFTPELSSLSYPQSHPFPDSAPCDNEAENTTIIGLVRTIGVSTCAIFGCLGILLNETCCTVVVRMLLEKKSVGTGTYGTIQ